jgi:hypothetical protein
MLGLSRTPHRDHGSRDSSHPMGVALEHYKRACAGRMGSREQRRCRERPIDRDEDRFAAPEIV